MRFIGKKYGDGDRVNGDFGAKWGEWFDNGWFAQIEQQVKGNPKDICEEGDATIGLMRDYNGVFEYWIGLFTPEGTTVPDEYAYIDFPAGNFGVCWVYGKEAEIFMREGQCGERLQRDGYNINADWCFERYADPRFTTPDDKGNIILDICFFVS